MATTSPGSTNGASGAESLRLPVVRTVPLDQEIHFTLDEKGYLEARERARKAIESRALGASIVLLDRIAEEAKEVPVKDASDLRALAGAYDAIETGQATAQGKTGNINAVIPVNFGFKTEDFA